MIGNFLKKIIGDKNSKDKSTYQPFVDSVNAVYPEIQNYTDNELREQTNIFIQKISEDKSELEEQLSKLKEEAEKPELSIQDKTEIFERVPDIGEGSSKLTLSLSNSTTGSSASTASPTCFNHLDTVASVTDSPKEGTII